MILTVKDEARMRECDLDSMGERARTHLITNKEVLTDKIVRLKKGVRKREGTLLHNILQITIIAIFLERIQNI